MYDCVSGHAQAHGQVAHPTAPGTATHVAHPTAPGTATHVAHPTAPGTATHQSHVAAVTATAATATASLGMFQQHGIQPQHGRQYTALPPGYANPATSVVYITLTYDTYL